MLKSSLKSNEISNDEEITVGEGLREEDVFAYYKNLVQNLSVTIQAFETLELSLKEIKGKKEK